MLHQCPKLNSWAQITIIIVQQIGQEVSVLNSDKWRGTEENNHRLVLKRLPW